MIESIIEKCKVLRLKAFAENLSDVIQMATQKNWPTSQVIEHLLDLELGSRRKSSIALRFNQSKLFEKPTIDQFDFSFHISPKNRKIES